MALAPHPRPHPGWISFCVAAIAGLLLALPVLGFLSMAECSPRDGSLEMYACDTTKQREFWLYPALVLTLLGFAAWLQFRRPQAGHAIALTCGLTGFATLWLVEALVG